MNEQPHDPIVVIGPPRSGTTLMAKILVRLGVFMGFNLNDQFEDMFFTKVNEHILGESNMYWDKPDDGLADPDDISIDRVVTRIKTSDAFNTGIQWGFKEPRATLTFRVWNEIFDQLGVGPIWIKMNRHPMDAAVSLCKKENNKPDDWLEIPHPPSRDIDEDDVYTYPVKSKRATTKEGALNIIQAYRQTCPLVPNGKDEYGGEVGYENLLEDQEFLFEMLPHLFNNGNTMEDIDELINPDRAHAFRQNEKLVTFWKQHK